MSPVLFAAVLVAATSQPTVEELQADFESALECVHRVDGRQVWKGQRAFFISTYTRESTKVDPDLVGADAVLRSDNDPDVIAEFEAACSP